MWTSGRFYFAIGMRGVVEGLGEGAERPGQITTTTKRQKQILRPAAKDDT
jgi:hypothetical protein